MQIIRLYSQILREVRGGNLKKKSTFWKKWSERIQRTKAILSSVSHGVIVPCSSQQQRAKNDNSERTVVQMNITVASWFPKRIIRNMHV
jgi:hypothetical protein